MPFGPFKKKEPEKKKEENTEKKANDEKPKEEVHIFLFELYRTLLKTHIASFTFESINRFASRLHRYFMHYCNFYWTYIVDFNTLLSLFRRKIKMLPQ